MASTTLARNYKDQRFETIDQLDELVVAQESVTDAYSKSMEQIQQTIQPTLAQQESIETIKILGWYDAARETRVRETELQWWYGKVTEVFDDNFSASVHELNGRMSLVTYDKSLVDPNEIDMLSVGNVFTYAISMIDKPTGREYSTRLSLSSKKTWHKEDEEKASVIAEDIFPERLLNL